MALAYSESAQKHYPIADGLHALRNRIRFVKRFDVDPDSGEVVDLVIGPARDGQMLEVFVHRRIPQTVFIFHVLHLRPKTLDRAQKIIEARTKGTG